MGARRQSELSRGIWVVCGSGYCKGMDADMAQCSPNFKIRGHHLPVSKTEVLFPWESFCFSEKKLFSFVGSMGGRNEELVQFLVPSLSSYFY